MQRVALFYPKNITSDNQYFKATLFYEDLIVGFVEYSNYQPEKEIYLKFEDEQIQMLYELDLFKPIFPKRVFGESMYKEIIIDNFVKEIIKIKDKLITNEGQDYNENESEVLYIPDIDGEIEDFLGNENLSFAYVPNKPSKSIGIIVDKKVFYAYYSVIISNILKYTNDSISIFTNSEIAQKKLLNNENSHKAGKLIFDNILPIPHESVPIKKIVEYKTKRKDELLRLRLELSDIRSKIKSLENFEEVKEIMMLKKEEIELALYDIKKSAKSDRLSLILENIENLFKLDNPDLLNSMVSAGIVSGISDPKIGLGAGVLTFGISSVNKLIKSQKNNSFAYLYNAKKRKILK